MSKAKRKALLTLCLFASVAVTLCAQKGPTQLIAELFEKAQQSLNQRELDKAESNYREILGIALDQLGAVYAAFRDYPMAERAYIEASRASIISDRPLLGLSIVYLRTGQYEKGIETVRKILQLKPMHSDARHVLGKLYFMKGDFEAASHELADALRSDPDATSVAYTLALAYLKQKRPESAEKILEQMAAKLGDSPQLRVLIGRAFRETGYLEQAAREFRKAIERDPLYPRAHYYHGLTALLQQGSAAVPLAIQEFEAELKRNPNEYFAHFYLGVLHGQNREFRKAIPFLQTAIKLNPSNPDPYLYLGQSFFQSGDHAQAVTSLKKSIELTTDPSRGNYQLSNAHYILGQALVKTGAVQEAAIHLKLSQELKSKKSEKEASDIQAHIKGEKPGTQAESMGSKEFSDLAQATEQAVLLDEEPPNQETGRALESAAKSYRNAAGNAYQGLAMVDTQRTPPDFSRAAGRLQKAVSWDDSLPDLHFNLALARFKAGQFAEAVAPLKEELSRNPSKEEARQLLANLSLILIENGLADAGAAAVEYLLEMNPGVPDLYVLRGQIYAQQGQYPEALKQFRTALEKNTSVPEAHYYLGTVLIRQGKLEEASEEFKKELDLNPRHARALYHQAFVLISLRKMGEAIPLLETAIKLEPRYADAYYQLGKAQLETGHTIQAVANLETATGLDPTKSYTFYQLSQAYTKSGRIDDAERALTRYRELKKAEESQRFK